MSQNDTNYKIDDLINYFAKNGIKYNLLFNKQGYPNTDYYMNIPGHRNTDKWLQAVKDIYYKEKQNINRVQAIRQVTSGWNVTETFDFLNWLRYHEEGAHLKYKYAQLWYENGTPGYFLHIKKDQPEPETSASHQDVDNAKNSDVSEISNSEKKRIIEKQRQKIVGRLDSAEKLLRTEEGQMFAGKELESLMETIYALKKKIQLVNKLSTSTRLYEDMIIREANILIKKGFDDAGLMLRALAQSPAQTAEQDKGDGNSMLPSAPPAPPAEGSGSVGGLPASIPGEPNSNESPKNDNAPASALTQKTPIDPSAPIASTPPAVVPDKNIPKGIDEFLEKMDTAGLTVDDSKVDDELEVFDNGEELIVEAQEIPAPPPVAPPMPKKEPVKTEVPLEVSEDDIVKSPTEKNEQQIASDFDSKVNSVFSNITIEDVVAKLEDLAKIFKTREVPRQLSIVDMMLDSLGLASYFPSLSEATNKSLESNNYISTRVEDILSKLRGAMKTKEIDLKGGEVESNPAVQSIKEKLQENSDKEKVRKEMRKNQENEELDNKGKETPEIEIEEDLTPPIPKAPIIPKTPLAPPAK